MKILFIASSGEYGGAEKHLIDLIRKFPDVDAQIVLLCLGPDFFTARLNGERTGRLQIECIEKPGSFWDWFRIFKRIRPDVVVFSRAWVYSYPDYVPLAAWLSRIPRRFSIFHTMPPKLEWPEGRSMRQVVSRLRRRLHFVRVRLEASFYSGTICVSDAIRNSWIGNYGFAASKTVTIHNGVSPSEFLKDDGRGRALRGRLGLSREDFLIVSTSRLSAGKGIEILISAMARVKLDGVRCKCLLVGDGPLREELEQQSKKLGLNGRVIFEGFQEDVGPYLHAADAFVLTSHREGLGISILEAMACGLPCLVTDAGGPAELITDGVHGLVVPPGSVDKVATGIAYLATRPSERAQMGKRSREKVADAFDVEKTMAQIYRVILN